MRYIARFLGLVGLGWMVWRLFGPDLAPEYRGIQERPMRVPGRSVFVGPREFFVREAGPPDAPPLVLVHGWSFDGEMTYFRVVPELARRYRVIVPDLRDHGKTDRIRGRFEISDLADELAGILTAIGIGKASFFGYSMGGMAVQEFARRYPHRVDRLMLGATAALPIDRRRAAARVGFWLARALARFSKRESVMFTYHFLVGRELLEPRYGRWIWEALLARDPTLYYECGNAVWRFDARSWVGSIRVPTMVVIPDQDRVVAVRTQRDLADRLPDPVVVEITGAGHESILTRGDDYVAAIDAFLGHPAQADPAADASP
jgi:pimeloyl-ACP methyl ester carboxylesterase